MTEEERNILLQVSRQTTLMVEAVAGLRRDMGGLNAEVAGLKQDVKTLTQDIASLKESVGRLEVRTTGIEQAVDDVRTQLREHRRGYASWLEEVSRELELVDHRARREARAEAEQRIVRVDERIDRLAERVAALEARREAAPQGRHSPQ